jgi:hypothetical protein
VRNRQRTVQGEKAVAALTSEEIMKGVIVAAVLALMFAPLSASVSLSARAQGVNFSNSEPRDEQSEAIACSQSRLQPPAGLDVECGRYPVSNSNCYKQGYAVQTKAGGPSIFVFAMTQGQGSRYCGIAAPQSVRTDMVMATKKYRPFVHDDATNWSKKPFELKHAGLALFFDSPKTDRDGKCVAFYQPGPPITSFGGPAQPPHGYLREYYMRGWICVPPGQTLTKDQAVDLIKSFKITAR